MTEEWESECGWGGGWRGRGGRGSDKAAACRGVWTCLEAAANKGNVAKCARAERRTCEAARFSAESASLVTASSLVYFYFLGLIFCQADPGQQTHKNSDWAVHRPAPSSVGRCRCFFTSTPQDFFFFLHTYIFSFCFYIVSSLSRAEVPACVFAAAALRHCSLCLKKPCFLLPRMTSRSAHPIGRRRRSLLI